MSKREIYRILDAAANRGREALRVVEDAARFLDDDRELTARLKETRHRFAAASERLDRRERLLARDTPGDVGTQVETDDEYRRASLADVLAANFARLQESTRSLEEFSKIVAPQTARDWEQIRYDAYSLEKIAFEALTRRGSDPFADDETDDARSETDAETDAAVETDAPDVGTTNASATPPLDDVSPEKTSETTSPQASTRESVLFPFASTRRSDVDRAWRRARLDDASFCSTADATLDDDDFRSIVRAGVDAFQFRFDPRTDSFDENESIARFRTLVEQEFSAADFPSGNRPLLTLRDRVDYVEAFDFDGAVLSRGADWEEARQILGADVLLGATVSTLDEAIAGFQAGAFGIVDFLEAGPIFASNDGAPPTGTAFLRALVESTAGAPPIPVFAFGGLDAQNLEEIFDSGIERVRVGAAILASDDKTAATERLKRLF